MDRERQQSKGKSGSKEAVPPSCKTTDQRARARAREEAAASSAAPPPVSARRAAASPRSEVEAPGDRQAANPAAGDQAVACSPPSPVRPDLGGAKPLGFQPVPAAPRTSGRSDFDQSINPVR